MDATNSGIYITQNFPNWITWVKELSLPGILGAFIGSISTILGSILLFNLKSKRNDLEKHYKIAEEIMINVGTSLTIYENEFMLLHTTSIPLTPEQMFNTVEKIKDAAKSLDRVEALSRLYIGKDSANLIRQIRLNALKSIAEARDGQANIANETNKKTFQLYDSLGNKISDWL